MPFVPNFQGTYANFLFEFESFALRNKKLLALRLLEHTLYCSFYELYNLNFFEEALSAMQITLLFKQ